MEIRRLGKQSKKVGPDGRDGVRFTRTRSKETRDESEHANFLVRMKQMRILENTDVTKVDTPNRIIKLEYLVVAKQGTQNYMIKVRIY